MPRDVWLRDVTHLLIHVEEPHKQVLYIDGVPSRFSPARVVCCILCVVSAMAMLICRGTGTGEGFVYCMCWKQPIARMLDLLLAL